MRRLTLTSIVAGVMVMSSFGQVAARKENQQDRIGQGVKSGQLTPGETANLEKRESGINRETRTDRNADGGHLTAAEKAKVNRQQNRVSKRIYADKHNTQTAPK